MAKKRKNARSRRGMANTDSLLTIGLLVGLPLALAGTLMFAAKRRAMKTASTP